MNDVLLKNLALVTEITSFCPDYQFYRVRQKVAHTISSTQCHAGRDRGGGRGAMAPQIIWLGGHNVFVPPPNILHWNLKF